MLCFVLNRSCFLLFAFLQDSVGEYMYANSMSWIKVRLHARLTRARHGKALCFGGLAASSLSSPL